MLGISVPEVTDLQLDELFTRAVETGYFVFDVEHDADADPYKPGFELWGMGFCVHELAYYVSGHERSLAFLTRLLEAGLVPTGHNIKFDVRCARACGLPPSLFSTSYCTMVAINLLEDWRHYKKLGLKVLIKELFDHQMMEYKEAAAHGKDSPEFYEYGREDVYWTWKLFEYCKPKLEEQNIWPMYSKILGKASIVFADIELKGVYWHIPTAVKLERAFGEVEEATKREAKDFLGHDINLNSSVQLSKRLFTDMKIPLKGLKLTPKGKPSTDEENIERLSKKYPAVRALRAYRTATKQISTYLAPNTEKARDHGGRLHTEFWITSSTGRTRNEGGLQTFTARWAKEIEQYFRGLSVRSCIQAPPGYSLLIVDFSQIELRLIAHITEDPGLLQAFRGWECKVCKATGSSNSILHTCPNCGAQEDEKKGFWHGLDLHADIANSISALGGDRNAGKTANFSIVYGASANTLHERYPNLPKGKWQEAIDEYFQIRRKVKHWHERCEVLLDSKRECVNLFGRRRRFLKDQIKEHRYHCINQIVNFNPQSSAADLIQLCMGKMRDKWVAEGIWFDGVCPVNMVHDELVFECREDLIPEVSKDIQHILENQVQFKVPIRAPVKKISNWGEGK